MANSLVYKKFNPDSDIIVSERVYTEGIFPSSIGTLSGSVLYTSSLQQASTSDSKDYFITVTDSGSGGNELFDIVYGESGSATDAYNAMYHQLAGMLLEDPTSKFTINSSEVNSIFAVSFKRANFKEELDPGNWEIQFDNGRIFVDDSGNSNGSVTINGSVYSVYTGSIDAGVQSTAREAGKLYSDLGVVVFDADYLTGSLSISATPISFFNDIDHVTARSSERLKESNFFCRFYNREFNYSNNETFTTGSSGEVRYSAFKNEPKVYPTTIGLYNDRNELVATARLSNPIEKSFSKEAIITCKLSY